MRSIWKGSISFGLVMPGRVEVVRPRGDQFVAWEPVLRAAIDGRPVYEPGSIDFRDRDGNELDLRRAFRIADPREDVGHFLAEERPHADLSDAAIAVSRCQQRFAITLHELVDDDVALCAQQPRQVERAEVDGAAVLVPPA